MKLDDLFVLLVEPSKVQRSIIIKHLNSLGIVDIEECSHGHAALEFMNQQLPDMVLCSMHLPDMTGTEIVKSMREHDEQKDVTFLLVSSETHYRYLEPIRQAGAIGILPKPFNQDELARVLRSTVAYLNDSDHEHSDEDFESLNILLVDDSKMSRRYFANILKNMGVQNIVEAEDGAQALKIFYASDFDLIVSDYHMPNIDGREMVEIIRHQTKQPTIPVMMITSEQDNTELAAIENAGVSALCKKPLSYEIMKKIIAQIVFSDV